MKYRYGIRSEEYSTLSTSGEERNIAFFLSCSLFNEQVFLAVCPIREQDGQASGGNDFGSDDWIFTIREKDPKKLQNGEGQSTDEVRFPLLPPPTELSTNQI